MYRWINVPSAIWSIIFKISGLRMCNPFFNFDNFFCSSKSVLIMCTEKNIPFIPEILRRERNEIVKVYIRNYRCLKIFKISITYVSPSLNSFVSPPTSQCAAVKTNLGAISDPAHPPSLKIRIPY